MTYNCENALYHYRHTGLLLFIFIFSYFFYLYQSFLFCQPSERYHKNRRSFWRFSEGWEILESLAFSWAFIAPLMIDYFIIRPSFGVTVFLYLYFLFLRVSFKNSLALLVLSDLICFSVVYYLQDNCFLVALIILRLLCEIIKLMTTYWANKALKVVKSVGPNVIGGCILFAWMFFYLLKR